MAGGHNHNAVHMDPALVKWNQMTVNRHKYFRWTPRTAWITFAYVVVVPGLFGIAGYMTDVSSIAWLAALAMKIQTVNVFVRANGRCVGREEEISSLSSKLSWLGHEMETKTENLFLQLGELGCVYLGIQYSSNDQLPAQRQRVELGVMTLS
ncbi:unnamed protein product [Periconia digitata]|uniref:Uncharacterized protein n=1 Tax=Periconia digitata TaxID=1303443 RepID=A0A9W4UKJ8_9PLEO|nr:unnamed protein product [Periconia digitata]